MDALVTMEMVEAVLRIEKKLDELLHRQESKTPIQPLAHEGQSCPLCSRPIRYVPLLPAKLGEIVMVRRCGCAVTTREQPVYTNGKEV